MNATASWQKSQAVSTNITKKIKLVLVYGFLIIVTFLIMVPIFWLLVTSLKLNTEYLSYPITFLPAVPQWSNYIKVFAPVYNFAKHALMTLYLAVIYSTLCTFSSALSGYAFARYLDVKANRKIFWIIIALIIIPPIVMVIPQFMIFAKLHLTGTYWPWVIWGLTGSPYHIFLFRQFFVSFPKDLEDAAEVDGCSPFGTFWQIFLPNAQAAIATSFILNFLWVWGDWFTPQIYLRADNTTLGVLVNEVFTNPQGQLLTTLTTAGIVVYTLPMIIIFFIGQRYILKGVVTSGLAGR